MSLKYGLNIKKPALAPERRRLLDDNEDEDQDAVNEHEDEEVISFSSNGALTHPRLSGQPKPTQPPQRREQGDAEQDLSSLGASKARLKAAEQVDPSIFDYDSFHDAKMTVSEAKQAAARQDAIERRPKYINSLLDAASRRKQEQLIAREKLLQKEREAEGDEFADKEKFVTGAYKQQQEETRRLEEEEKRKAEAEEKRKRQVGGGMSGFYQTIMDQSERQHREAMEAAAKLEQEGGAKRADQEMEKTDAELAAELKSKGINIHVNEEGQITDKRELLSAGLNVTPAGKKPGDERGADHLRTSSRPAQHSAFQSRNAASQQAQRERQSRMVEEQLAAQAKRAREEDEAERTRMEKATKTQKTEKDVSDAKARYLARRAAKERGEG